LTVKANLGRGTSAQPFLEGDQVHEVLARYQIDVRAWLGSRAGQYCLLAAAPNGTAAIGLTVYLDTDDESFCHLATKVLEQLNAQAAGQTRAWTTDILLSPRDGAYREEGQISLELDPAYAASFGGAVALDLGNTNTTLAFLEGQEDDPKKIKLVDANED